MWKDTIMISPKYTLADYQNLNVTTNSDTKTWNKAIDIFVDRIYGRFFAPIETLLNDFGAPEENGFAIMALSCFLTETMLQFAEGKKRTLKDSKSDKNSNMPIEICDEEVYLTELDGKKSVHLNRL